MSNVKLAVLSVLPALLTGLGLFVATQHPNLYVAFCYPQSNVFEPRPAGGN